MTRVANKNGMIARRASKVVLNVRTPRRATKQAHIFIATRIGQGFAGGLLC
jgi:hypothetical protein